MSKETKVIALHVIQRTIKPGEYGDRGRGIPGTKPEIQTIEPGSVFMASNELKRGERESEYDSLLKSGAIRDYTKEDHAVFSRLSNVIGGGEFDEDPGTATVTQKVIKPKKPAKEVAEGEGAGSNQTNTNTAQADANKGAIKSGAKAPAKAKATEGQSQQGAGDGDGGGAGNEGDGEGDGDEADSVV
jgi:hypothetical protein